MDLVRGLINIRDRHQGCVATIGNFDGIHLGHQAVIAQLRALARRQSLPAAAILFEPQPQEYFQLKAAPARLSHWREKFERLCALGIDRIICLKFDGALAALTADTFVEDILVRRLGIQALVVGDDFRFGRQRQGDFELLCDMGTHYGFSTERAATHCVNGERVSSTGVRAALGRGDLATARALLGSAYKLSGRIVHGEKRGRTIGFATANVNLRRLIAPLHGIFAARTYGLGDDTPRDSVAYIGPRPIVGGTHDVLEVHVFDFQGECYGQRIRVEFVEKIRDDRPFESFDDLRDQIAVDAEQAIKILNSRATEYV